jgi:hypothetical protein
MEQMNEIQKTALDFWLSGIEFENEFKPNSDQKVSDYMKSIGHSISKSGIYKWRVKYNWQKELEFRVKQLTSEDKRIRASIEAASKDETVEKTLSDLERNKALLGQGYAILELKCKLIMEKYQITKKLSNEDVKIALQITQLTAGREDRLLDRKVLGDALGREDALKAIMSVAGEIEFDGEGEFSDDMFQSGEIVEVDIEEEDNV